MRFLISTTIKITESIAATLSATGPAYITPSIPQSIGKITISGSRQMICLVKERKIPLLAFPMEVKKFDVIGWIPFKNVQNI